MNAQTASPSRRELVSGNDDSTSVREKLSSAPPKLLTDESLRLAADECYWALLENLPKGMNSQAMRYATEGWLPLSLDEVEIRFVQVGESTIACGVERRWLRDRIDQHEINHRCVESITPSEFPACIMNRLQRGSDAEIAGLFVRLEFRSLDYESPRSARRRRAMMVIAMATLAAVTAFASIGFMRRAAGADEIAQRADTAKGQLVDSVLGASRSASSAPELRLAATMVRLEATRDRSVSGLLARDAGAVLIELLAAWPDAIDTEIDTVRVEQDVVTLKGRVRQASDAESLKLTLDEAMDGWTVQSASVSKGRVGYEFTLILSESREDQRNGAAP